MRTLPAGTAAEPGAAGPGSGRSGQRTAQGSAPAGAARDDAAGGAGGGEGDTASGVELAATVVLLRDVADGLQVLLLERPRHSGSFAGAWVFPGGKIDPADRAGAEPDLSAARRAGGRECREETGLEVSADELVELSCWIPPEHTPRRFRTWFFLAPAPAGGIVLNAGEIIDYAWLSPREALRRHGESLMQLVPPTWVTLHSLLPAQSADSAIRLARRTGPETFQGRLLTAAGPGPGPVIVWAGDDEYEREPGPPPRGTPPGPPSGETPPGPPAGETPPPGEVPNAAPSQCRERRHRLSIGTLPWVYERDEASQLRPGAAG